MNYSTMICLLSDEVRGIAVTYSKPLSNSAVDTPDKLYTFKSMDDTLKRGDMVVVPTQKDSGYTVVYVWDTDAEIDVESSIQYNWVAGRFDATQYNELLANEQHAISKVKRAEKLHRRKEISDRVFASVDEEELKAISFGSTPSKLTADTADKESDVTE
jgi:hypothetical protein